MRAWRLWSTIPCSVLNRSSSIRTGCPSHAIQRHMPGLPAGSWRCGSAGRLVSVNRHLIEDDDVEREDRERPERVTRKRQQGADSTKAGRDDRDYAPVQATGPEREGRAELQQAKGERDPAPRVQVAEDVLLVLHEEARVADRGDAVDDVQNADDEQHHAGERDPPGATIGHVGLLAFGTVMVSPKRVRRRHPPRVIGGSAPPP